MEFWSFTEIWPKQYILCLFMTYLSGGGEEIELALIARASGA
jgi:hypothetical protein